MFAIGLSDGMDSGTYYGPFTTSEAAHIWLETHHSDSYAIRGDFNIIRIEDPKQGEK